MYKGIDGKRWPAPLNVEFQGAGGTSETGPSLPFDHVRSIEEVVRGKKKKKAQRKARKCEDAEGEPPDVERMDREDEIPF